MHTVDEEVRGVEPPEGGVGEEGQQLGTTLHPLFTEHHLHHQGERERGRELITSYIISSLIRHYDYTASSLDLTPRAEVVLLTSPNTNL